eukprot:1063793-Amphidinium_carterae.3
MGVLMWPGYGAVSGCPNGQWSAVLVEANPLFTTALSKLASDYSGSVDAKSGQQTSIEPLGPTHILKPICSTALRIQSQQ